MLKSGLKINLWDCKVLGHRSFDHFQVNLFHIFLHSCFFIRQKYLTTYYRINNQILLSIKPVITRHSFRHYEVFDLIFPYIWRYTNEVTLTKSKVQQVSFV